MDMIALGPDVKRFNIRASEDQVITNIGTINTYIGNTNKDVRRSFFL